MILKNKVTMKDIANRLGVSSVTISKALNDKEGVSEELKEKIKKVANEMGYRYNTLAKSMKEGLSYNIGVIVAERFTGDIQSFYLRFYKHITKALEDYNYYGILHTLSYEEEKERILPRIYKENRVDGIIVLGQLEPAYIDLLKEIDIPIIFLDFYDYHTDIQSVNTDNFYGAYEITNYLIDNGHREIAFVGNIYSTSSIQDRFLGYYKSLLEHHIPLKEEYIIKDRNEKGQYIELKFPEVMPTAFVCNCDQVAYNVVNALKKMGYKIPDDCSMVGFDNDIYACLTEPNLTTVEVDMNEMSQTAVRLLINRIQNQAGSPTRVLIPGKIIIRDSVKNLNGNRGKGNRPGEDG